MTTREATWTNTLALAPKVNTRAGVNRCNDREPRRDSHA